MDEVITDPLGRPITLHDRTWFGHIIKGHPEMAEHRTLVELVLAAPTQIRNGLSAPANPLYFGPGPRPGVMILVAVDVELGLVKTAHLTRRFSGRTVEWSSQTP